jgi:predicted amidohydrolase
MTSITLAAANVAIHQDKGENLHRFFELIDEAAARHVDILVLPEMGLQGYADFALPAGSKERAEQKQYFFHEAETIPGPSTEAIRQAAQQHGMHIQLGLAESALDGNAIYNSTALIGPEGVIGTYRKVHNPFEYPYFSAGEESPVFDTPFGRAASVICYDLCFPELPRSYALAGADLILMSSAWPMKGHDRAEDYYGWAMDLAAQANAFFNQIWLVVSNHCNKGVYSTGLDYYGGSQIVDPYGDVVAYLADEEGLVVHTADLIQTIRASRTDGFFGHNLLQDRRPEHYGLLVDQWYRHPAKLLPGDSGITSPPENGTGTTSERLSARDEAHSR